MNPRYQCFRRDGAVGWRLLSGNHRSLAASAVTFPTLEEAVRDADSIRSLAADAELELVSYTGTTWRWVMLVDGVPRAVAAVSYARRLECVRAMERFRACAATAEVSSATLPERPRSSMTRLRAPRVTPL